MAQHTQEFSVEREVGGETEEITLKIEFEVYPFVPGRMSGPPEMCYPDEGGFAEINKVMTETEDEWDGELTDKEEERFCTAAYESWCESADDDLDLDEYDDPDLLDRDFDFHDERAVAISGRGKVYF